MIESIRQVAPRALQFGIYRDGDNNLDGSQAAVLAQAAQTSAQDGSIAFNVMNETHDGGALHTDTYSISGGVASREQDSKAQDMANPKTLAGFVAQTLDAAEKSGAQQTWLDLVDHGGGDGGGLEADSTGHIMSVPGIAKAIADGIAMHAKEHPEDAARGVDGVVANQCLMATMGFADALSADGVKYLAASPETMLSPGATSSVAHAIAKNVDDPQAMAKGVVKDVMHTKYGPSFEKYSGAAAFDVLDLNAKKIATAENAIKSLNDDVASAAKDTSTRSEIRDDVRGVDGMVRFPEATPDMPWHADRPAMAMYRALANDTRLDASLRNDATAAAGAVGSLVMAHKESSAFAPFDGADYRDAVGPTVHAPVTPKQIDPWAPAVSETDNSFYAKTDQDKFVRAVA